MLPGDAAGALDMEVDMEWYGGGFITIETRIDVRDQIAQEKVASQMAKSGSSGDAAAALVSGIGQGIDSADLSSSDMLEGRQAAGHKKTGSGTIMFSSISLKLWMPDFLCCRHRLTYWEPRDETMAARFSLMSARNSVTVGR